MTTEGNEEEDATVENEDGSVAGNEGRKGDLFRVTLESRARRCRAMASDDVGRKRLPFVSHDPIWMSLTI